MRHQHYVGLDVHCQFTQVAVISESGQLLRQQQCPTTIPAIAQTLESVRRPLSVALEEGPLADWISRNLAGMLCHQQRICGECALCLDEVRDGRNPLAHPKCS